MIGLASVERKAVLCNPVNTTNCNRGSGGQQQEDKNGGFDQFTIFRNYLFTNRN